MKNYYKILGVRESAGEADIKTAYRALAIKFHPDKNPSPEATIRFTEITEAYNVLGDPQKKFVYDHQWYKFVNQPVQEVRKPHHDPKYRQPRTSGKRERPAHFLFMEKWNRAAYWVNVTGAILVMLFAADFFLPYVNTTEVIRGYEPVYRGRKSVTLSHHRMYTESGRNIKVFGWPGKEGEEVKLSVSFLLRTPMQTENLQTQHTEHLAYMYQPQHLVFPAMLLLAGVIGMANRRNVEQAFGCCVGTVILLIINYFLIR